MRNPGNVDLAGQDYRQTDHGEQMCEDVRAALGDWMHNVEVIRTNEGAACAPHKTCLRRVPDATIG